MSSAGKRFTGQVALITGGAQGIGYGVAEYLGKEGAAVVLLDMSADALAASVAKLTAAGITASSQTINVTKEEDWARAVAEILTSAGRIDVLVQAAGITGTRVCSHLFSLIVHATCSLTLASFALAGKTGIKTEAVSPADWDAVMAVNARGIFLGCRAVLPAMVARGYGRVVNIASVAGKEGNAGMVAYSASKGAVIALTKAAGKEYAETGVTVNALAPAVVRTAMVDAMPEEQVKYMTDKIPMKRCGTIAEIAALAAFIASPEAGFTTGFTFDATGGRATY